MKKFIYINIDGREKEELSYEVADFTSIAAPSSPVITTPAGTLDPSLIPATILPKSSKLMIERVAGEDIVFGEIVTSSDNFGEVILADANTNAKSATVLGVATQTKNATETIEILVLGVFYDPAYSAFPVNSQLFLDLDGAITNDRPTSPSRKYLTNIGKSLGGGEVLINPANPIQLGV